MPSSPAPLWSSSQPSRLLTSRHAATGERVFPPVSADSPLARQFEPAALTTAGALYSFTTIHPSAKSGLSPYSVGYVDFEEDAGRVRLFGRLLGSDVPSIGDRFEPVPDEKLGYAFQPASA